MKPRIRRYGRKIVIGLFGEVNLLLFKLRHCYLRKTTYKNVVNRKTTSLGATKLMRAILFVVEFMH